MIKLFLTLLLTSGCLFALAQEETYSVNWTSEQADSVKMELRSSANDTLRMKMARSLGIYHQEINRDTSLFYHQLQIKLAKKLKQPLWEADAYDAAGWVLSQLKNFPLSLEYLLTAMKIANNKDIEKNIWQLDFFSKKKDADYARLTTLGFIYNDLSQLYRQIGDIEKEVQNIRRGIAVASQISNEVLLGLLKSNLSQVKLTEHQPDSVIYFGKQGLEHMKNSGYTTYEGYELTLLGEAYIQKKDFATAKNYLDKSIIVNQVNRSVVKLPDAYFSYASLYKALGQPDSDRVYLNKAVTAFTFFGLPEKVKQAYGLLYNFYKIEKKSDSAYYYLQLYQALSDSLNKKEKDQIHAYQNIAFNEQIERQQTESLRIQKANTYRTVALSIGIAVLLLIAFLLFRNNQTRRKANSLLQQQKAEIEQQKIRVENTLTELKSTQQQLIQSEKMASLGELTAGIAHEIQNPLNFVNNFSEVSNELIDEMNAELDKGDIDEAKIISNDIKQNLEKINHHGKRADAIVKGMLQHSQSSKGKKEPTDINALCDEYLRLSYHGLRAKDKSFNATMKTDFDKSIGNINIIPQDIGRVILNLINNAFYAVAEKKKEAPQLPKGGAEYLPTVTVSTKLSGSPSGAGWLSISVSDNGNGIPQNIVDKIFQPFFTTKPTGQGTGLGLSLSYDIIKAHGGEIKVDSKENEGTTFIIQLPV
ncbi:MAG: ATP-binding protein [Ferruginibacter sp.]